MPCRQAPRLCHLTNRAGSLRSSRTLFIASSIRLILSASALSSGFRRAVTKPTMTSNPVQASAAMNHSRPLTLQARKCDSCFTPFSPNRRVPSSSLVLQSKPGRWTDASVRGTAVLSIASLGAGSRLTRAGWGYESGCCHREPSIHVQEGAG
jgi:hypothetical protein